MVATALITAPILSYADVVYTDVNPDVTLNTSGETFGIDLNGDLVDDFSININLGIVAPCLYSYVQHWTQYCV